jgi:predicted amidohydrolase
MDRIAKIGFFHFGNGHGAPMRALRCELRKKAPEDLKNALVVLPEGFNIGKCYHDSKAEVNPEPNVTRALKSEALKYEIMFVAALILESQQKKRSSAYLINADGESPLCHKMVPDGMGDYDPCRDCCDENNPRAYGGALVGCLICADSDPPRPLSWREPNEERARLSAVINKMRSRTTTPTILCIPAHPHTLSGGGAPSAWPNYTVIFASSCDRAGHGSSIGHLGQTLAEAEGPANVITIVNLPVPSGPKE